MYSNLGFQGIESFKHGKDEQYFEGFAFNYDWEEKDLYLNVLALCPADATQGHSVRTQPKQLSYHDRIYPYFTRVYKLLHQSRRFNVEADATLGKLFHETQAACLATPVEINPTNGVAGLVLGDEFGWLTRIYGLVIDNPLSAELITADGNRSVSSKTEQPNQFWVNRGGGANCGIG